MPVLKYGSREWLRRLPRSTPPVGALRGVVIVRVPGARPLPFAKVVGGSPEAPTCIGVAPEEMDSITWVTGPASTGASRAWDSRMGDWMSVGEEKKDAGAGATPWIFGGLLIAAAVAVAAAEKKMGSAR